MRTWSSTGRAIEQVLWDRALAERAKPARLRHTYRLRQAESVQAAIGEEQARLIVRFGDAVPRRTDLPPQGLSSRHVLMRACPLALKSRCVQEKGYSWSVFSMLPSPFHCLIVIVDTVGRYRQ